MTIGWNGETLPEVPLEAEIEMVAAAGYGGLELFTPKLAPLVEKHGTAGLDRLLRSNNLSALGMNCLENVNLRSAQDFAAMKDECRRLSEISHAIGCPTIVIVPSPLPDGIAFERAIRDTIAAVQELADIAAEHGVKIALEFLAQPRCSVKTLIEASEIVRQVERDNVGIVFDTYHFHVGGSGWASLDLVPIDRLFIVHINDAEDLPLDQLTDAHRLLPGEGIFPLARILAKLYARGYRGAYSLEVMRPAYRDREPLEYMRAAFQACRGCLERARIA